MKKKKENRDNVLLGIMNNLTDAIVDNNCSYDEVSKICACVFLSFAKDMMKDSVTAMLKFTMEFIKLVHKSTLELIKDEYESR